MQNIKINKNNSLYIRGKSFLGLKLPSSHSPIYMAFIYVVALGGLSMNIWLFSFSSYVYQILISSAFFALWMFLLHMKYRKQKETRKNFPLDIKREIAYFMLFLFSIPPELNWTIFFIGHLVFYFLRYGLGNAKSFSFFPLIVLIWFLFYTSQDMHTPFVLRESFEGGWGSFIREHLRFYFPWMMFLFLVGVLFFMSKTYILYISVYLIGLSLSYLLGYAWSSTTESQIIVSTFQRTFPLTMQTSPFVDLWFAQPTWIFLFSLQFEEFNLPTQISKKILLLFLLGVSASIFLFLVKTPFFIACSFLLMPFIKEVLDILETIFSTRGTHD